MTAGVTFRRYDDRDAEAVWELHERAMADAGTDPASIPGTDDLRRVGTAYLDAGGEFLVGVEATPAVDGLATHDGSVVAMGGFLPCEHGHADERTVPGGAELHRMRVAPARQGRGYGRELLARLERRATARGFDPVLATTAERQTAAVALYESAGYERVGRSREGEYELVHFERGL